MKNPTLSIVIVHYQLESILYQCIKSILSSKSKITYEIIIVDNGSKDGFKERLLKKYPNINYFKSPKNLGYGRGNNLGSKKAKGKFLFFLNPDTKVQEDTLNELFLFLDSHFDCGIVAPSLLHGNKKLFKQQGSLTLTPMRAVAAHSIFHKLWPHNPIAKRFWLSDFDKTKNRKVEVVPGTAFIISKSLFEKVGKFDQNFFLYFEEYDLCKRVLSEKKEIWMLGSAKIIHHWGSTTSAVDVRKIYLNSFKYYLVKHYGWLIGNLTFFITQLSKYHYESGILFGH